MRSTSALKVVLRSSRWIVGLMNTVVPLVVKCPPVLGEQAVRIGWVGGERFLCRISQLRFTLGRSSTPTYREGLSRRGGTTGWSEAGRGFSEADNPHPPTLRLQT
jgi:hypothetical protein